MDKNEIALVRARSLSGLGGLKRGSGKASTNVHDFETHSGSTQRKIGDIWAFLPLPQPVLPKANRLQQPLLTQADSCVGVHHLSLVAMGGSCIRDIILRFKALAQTQQ